MAIITDYFAFGTTLANMVNLQLTASEAAVLLTQAGGKPMPLLGGVRAGSAASLKRGGFANAVLAYPSLYRSEFNALVLALWGDFTTAKKVGYISMLDESGYYSPFSCVLERPVIEDHYSVTFNLTPVDVRINVWDGVLQTVTKTSNFNHTTAERYVLVDTSGGSVTGTLAAASTYTPYTVYSFIKGAAGNNMVLDGNGSELISGASTLTLTANGARADIFTDGVAWYQV